MTVLNPATKLYLGNVPVIAAYAGATKVWPPVLGAIPMAGLVTWLDAADYTPGSWPNKGSGPAVTLSGLPVPTISANKLNGKPLVSFISGGGRVRSVWNTAPHDYTLIYIMRWTGPGKGRSFSVQYPPSNMLIGTHDAAIDAMYDNGGWTYGGGAGAPPWWSPPPSPWRTYEADSTSTAGARFFVDGVLAGGYNNSANVQGGLYGGWGLSGYDVVSANETLDMEVAELVLYDHKLTDVDRQKVEKYLNDKWFPPPAPLEVPETVPGLTFWLDASKLVLAEGDPVATWPDASPSHFDAVTVNDANRPIYRASTTPFGKPGVEFNPSPYRYLDIPGLGTWLSGRSAYTLIILIKPLGSFGNFPVIMTAPNNGLWHWLVEFDQSNGVYWGHLNGHWRMYAANMVIGDWAILEWVLGTPKHFYKNGADTGIQQLSSGGDMVDVVPDVGTTARLGAYYDGGLGTIGPISEILLYDHALTDPERIKIEQYLNNKWLPPTPESVLRPVLGTPTMDAAEGATTRYTLGTWFSLYSTQKVLGVSIYNPGWVTFSPAGTRRIYLWSSPGATFPGGPGTVKIAEKVIPDKLPPGWSDHFFDVPQTLLSGDWYGVSYDSWPGGDIGTHGDYSHFADAFLTSFRVGDIGFPVAAGKYANANGSPPTENYNAPWYGVDVIRSMA